MKIMEYGQQNPEVILLLHGGGLSWWNYRDVAKLLAHGGGNIFDGWTKNPKSAMISCNDGFRPVSFCLEALEEEAKA